MRINKISKSSSFDLYLKTINKFNSKHNSILKLASVAGVASISDEIARVIRSGLDDFIDAGRGATRNVQGKGGRFVSWQTATREDWPMIWRTLSGRLDPAVDLARGAYSDDAIKLFFGSDDAFESTIKGLLMEDLLRGNSLEPLTRNPNLLPSYMLQVEEYSAVMGRMPIQADESLKAFFLNPNNRSLFRTGTTDDILVAYRQQNPSLALPDPSIPPARQLRDPGPRGELVHVPRTPVPDWDPRILDPAPTTTVSQELIDFARQQRALNDAELPALVSRMDNAAADDVKNLDDIDDIAKHQEEIIDAEFEEVLPGDRLLGETGGGANRTGRGTGTGRDPNQTGGGNRETGGDPNQTGGGNRETGGDPNQTGGGNRETGGGPNQTGGGNRETGGGPNQTGGGPNQTGGGPNQTGGGNRGAGGDSEKPQSWWRRFWGGRSKPEVDAATGDKLVALERSLKAQEEALNKMAATIRRLETELAEARRAGNTDDIARIERRLADMQAETQRLAAAVERNASRGVGGAERLGRAGIATDISRTVKRSLLGIAALAAALAAGAWYLSRNGIPGIGGGTDNVAPGPRRPPETDTRLPRQGRRRGRGLTPAVREIRDAEQAAENNMEDWTYVVDLINDLDSQADIDSLTGHYRKEIAIPFREGWGRWGFRYAFVNDRIGGLDLMAQERETLYRTALASLMNPNAGGAYFQAKLIQLGNPQKAFNAAVEDILEEDLQTSGRAKRYFQQRWVRQNQNRQRGGRRRNRLPGAVRRSLKNQWNEARGRASDISSKDKIVKNSRIEELYSLSTNNHNTKDINMLKEADEISKSYHKDAVKDLNAEDKTLRDYFAGLGRLYDEESNREYPDYKELYELHDETGRDLTLSAHPKAIRVSDAMGDGGLVENGLEQKNKMEGVALSTPTGNFTSRYANLKDLFEKVSK